MQRLLETIQKYQKTASGLIGLISSIIAYFANLPPDPATDDFSIYRVIGYLVGFALALTLLSLRDKSELFFGIGIPILVGLGCVFVIDKYLTLRSEVENRYLETAIFFAAANALIGILLVYALPILSTVARLTGAKEGSSEAGPPAKP